MTHPFGLLRQSIEDELTPVKKLSQQNFHFPCFQVMLPRLRRLIGLQYRRLVNELSLFKIVKLWKYSWLLPHEQAICFGSLIWLSRNKSVQKSRFSKENCHKISRIFNSHSLSRSIRISLFTSRKRVKAFPFYFALLEKEWKHFFSLCTFRKRVKAFLFHFSLLDLQKPTLAGRWFIIVMLLTDMWVLKINRPSWSR